jgi:hypothetical protein
MNLSVIVRIASYLLRDTSNLIIKLKLYTVNGILSKSINYNLLNGGAFDSL